MEMNNKGHSSGHMSHGMPSGDAQALKIAGWLTGICDTSYPPGLLLLIFKSQNGGLFDGETSSEIGSG